MTVPGWDAREWHQRHAKQQGPPKPRSKRSKQAAIAAVVLLVAGAAAVSADHIVDDGPEPIGVCHATGSESNPYVFLVVDKNSYEHAHHRHHDGDFFRGASVGHCDGDPGVNATQAGAEPVADGGNVTDGAAVGNATEEAAADTTEAEGDATAEAKEDGTAEENGTTDDASAGDNGAVKEDGTAHQNGTSDQNASAGSASAPNVRVSQKAFQDEFQVRLSLVVESVGDAAAQNVTLADALPELHRTWHLGGADHDACVLEDRDLRCWFGELAPGGSVAVELTAYTDRMPCGYAKTNTAHVSADGDAEERDNASSAGIAARPC